MHTFSFAVGILWLVISLLATSGSTQGKSGKDNGKHRTGFDFTAEDYPYSPDNLLQNDDDSQNETSYKPSGRMIANPCPEPPRKVTPDDVKFYYYGDPKNVDKVVQIKAADVATSGIDIKPDRPFIVITHGFTQYYRCEISQDIKDAHLSKLEDNAAVVVVDYAGIACADEFITIQWGTCYSKASCALCAVAEQIVDLLAALKNAGKIQESKIHLIGFSLGVPISGCAGKIFTERFQTKIDRITGLDPAGNIFDICNPRPCRYRSMTPTDARVVVGVHTNGGMFGTMHSMGHFNFFPNSGVGLQPGCIFSFRPGCSHFAAAAFYVKAVKDPKSYLAHKCPSYNDFLHNFDASCKPTGLYMGPLMDAAGEQGNYYFKSPVPSSHSGRYDRC